MEVYFYIPAEDAENAAECGISLERYATGTMKIGGYERKYFTALLHPKDDPAKYGSADHTCMLIEADERYAFVSDASVRDAAESDGRLAGRFGEMAVPLKEYILGSFRKPICLITSTVLPGKASVAGKSMGSPLMYNDSEEFFVDCLFEKMKDHDDRFVEKTLYRFWDDLATKGEVSKYVDGRSKMAVFHKEGTLEYFPLRIPADE